MKVLNKITSIVSLLLIIVMQLVIILPVSKVYAATSPTLNGSSGYSVLGGAAITNVGTTTTDGAVGVSPGTSITGGTITAGGGIHSNDASAIAAQADISTATTGVWDVLDQACDYTYGAQDLTLISPLVPGVYCSTSSFSLSGNLTLTGTGVWIFKTVSTLITSSGSSVTGGDACNVWWRIGSAATFGTTTSFIGNIITANVADTTALGTGATLNGRVLAQAAQTVTLAGNTISGPTCSATPTPTPTPTPTSTSSSSSSTSSSGGSSSTGTTAYPAISDTVIPPTIIESRRVDADSIFISWGPYSGVDTFNVQYGLENGKWLYSTKVTGFTTTINGLSSNQAIWVRVAADNGSIGTYGEAKLVGGQTVITVNPNVLGISFPDTGFAPSQNNIPWYVWLAILAGISTLFVLIQRKLKSS